MEKQVRMGVDQSGKEGGARQRDTLDIFACGEFFPRADIGEAFALDQHGRSGAWRAAVTHPDAVGKEKDWRGRRHGGKSLAGSALNLQLSRDGQEWHARRKCRSIVNNTLQALRNADFLTRQRIALWSAALLIGFGVALAFMAMTAHGVNDYKGRPLGSDFSNIYAAGTWVREGKPAAPFDLARQHAREQALFGQATPFYGWHYPPYFLFVAGLLAEMPYGLALTVWQAVTLALYLLIVWKIVAPSPGAARKGDLLLLALAFP